MSERRALKMAEVMDELFDGPHATPPPADVGPVFLGIKNITDAGALDLSEVRHISEADFGRWTKRVTPEAGDLVFTYEATLHRYALIPEGFRGCLGRRLALIRPDKSVVDPRFLHYTMLGPEWRATVTERIISGSTVDRIPLLTFPDFPISLPPLDVQRRVADVLGAIDDLIENYRQRVKVAEEMAQAIYQEWFVHFRYPGHADVPLVDSSLGPVPDGWPVASPSALGEIAVGGDWGREAPDGDGWTQVACLRGVDLPKLRRGDRSSVKVRWVKDASLQKRLLTPADVVVEGSGECGRSLTVSTRMADLVGAPVVYSNFCKRLTCESPAHAMFVSRLFNTMVKDGTMTAFKTGTAIPNLNFRALVENHLIPLPPRDVLLAYEDRVRPLEEFALSVPVAQLQSIRDLLLPRLVAGDIDLSRLDLGKLDEAVSA